MATNPTGWFDLGLKPAGWFDETAEAAGWFDETAVVITSGGGAASITGAGQIASAEATLVAGSNRLSQSTTS